jgi:hypothetical protein
VSTCLGTNSAEAMLLLIARHPGEDISVFRIAFTPPVEIHKVGSGGIAPIICLWSPEPVFYPCLKSNPPAVGVAQYYTD